MPPAQQPFVRSHQSRVVRYSGCSDKTICRIGVKAFELGCEYGDFAGQRKLHGACA